MDMIEQLDITYLEKTGLLFEMNRKILNSLGLALIIVENGNSLTLTLYRCNDPAGFTMEEELIKSEENKLKEFFDDIKIT